MRPLRILQLVGSPTNDFYRELSELYARGCLDALHDPGRYEFVIAHVSPDGAWRFPASLGAAAIAGTRVVSFAQAIATIDGLAIDVAVPQMFCLRGMTDFRALLEVLHIPYLGNRPVTMAIAADKSMAKAIVAAAGVDVPRSQRLRAGDSPRIAVPAVVKPNDSDNSDGVTLVRTAAQYAGALRTAFAFSHSVIAEEYIELGREVRCGVVEWHGELTALPLEEYFVDTGSRPVRRRVDKVKRNDGGDMMLAAKTKAESWIVPVDDPVTAAVWAVARQCFTALGSRQYNLFDFRIDPQGRPWFLEAGPYCSFSPASVVVTMMAAAGIPLDQFFRGSVEAALRSSSAT